MSKPRKIFLSIHITGILVSFLESEIILSHRKSCSINLNKIRSALYNPWEMLQTSPPDRCVMGRHAFLRSVWRCYCVTIWVIVSCFKHLWPEVLGCKRHFTCKSNFPFLYLENQNSEIKTDGLFQNTCIDIKAETEAWCPNVWTAFSPPGAVDLFPADRGKPCFDLFLMTW